MIKSAALALICFLLFLILHFYLFHFMKPKKKFSCVKKTALTAGIGYILLYFFSPSEQVWESWIPVPAEAFHFVIGAFFYFFLFIGYLDVYYNADHSITFRMLTFIEKSKKLTCQEMISFYQPNQIITRRFDDMEYGGYLKQNGMGAYSLTSKGKIAEKIYRFMISFLHFRAF